MEMQMMQMQMGAWLALAQIAEGERVAVALATEACKDVKRVRDIVQLCQIAKLREHETWNISGLFLSLGFRMKVASFLIPCSFAAVLHKFVERSSWPQIA